MRLFFIGTFPTVPLPTAAHVPNFVMAQLLVRFIRHLQLDGDDVAISVFLCWQ